jgi:hypothetical protein
LVLQIFKDIGNGICTSVADRDPGSGAFLSFDPWIQDPGWVKSQPRSYFSELRNPFFLVKILKFFDTDPGGWKKFGSGLKKKSDPGSGINIPDSKH